MSAARTAEAKGGVGVSKDDKRDKEKDKKEKNGKSAVVSQTGAVDDGWVCEEVKAAGAYTDGHPLDSVQYMEAKIILKPDRFVSVDSFREFGRTVQRTAKEVGVGFITDPKVGRRPDIREIVFMDTPDFRLYNNAFILRRRITYIDGFPVGDPEIVFKYRHPDEKTAAAVDVRPKISGKYRIKFKAEALPLKDRIGSYRVLYSHNCVFGLSQVHEADRTSMATLVRVFPALEM